MKLSYNLFVSWLLSIQNFNDQRIIYHISLMSSFKEIYSHKENTQKQCIVYTKELYVHALQQLLKIYHR